MVIIKMLNIPAFYGYKGISDIIPLVVHILSVMKTLPRKSDLYVSGFLSVRIVC